LATRDRERVDDEVGGGFPEPVPDLIVERLHFTGLDDVSVMAQAVEELRSVRLRVDWLQLVPLDEDIVLVVVDHRPRHVRAGSHRMNVGSGGARPDPSQTSKRTDTWLTFPKAGRRPCCS
jgi:hypothetical protein